jgi:hypothetical protein
MIQCVPYVTPYIVAASVGALPHFRIERRKQTALKSSFELTELFCPRMGLKVSAQSRDGQSQFIVKHIKQHPMPKEVQQLFVDVGAHGGVWLSNSSYFLQPPQNYHAPRAPGGGGEDDVRTTDTAKTSTCIKTRQHFQT